MCEPVFIARSEWGPHEDAVARKALLESSGKREDGRKRLCGAWTLRGGEMRDPNQWVPRRGKARVTGRVQRFLRMRCKCWACSRCGPRKAKQYRAQILKTVDHLKLTRLMTLTLDPRLVATEEEVKTFYEHFEESKKQDRFCVCPTCMAVQRRSIPIIRDCWNKLRVYLHRRYGQAPKYIAVLEFQKSTGLARMHIVLDRYVEQAWARNVWMAVGGGQHVDLRAIDAHRAAAYLSKYLSKELLLSVPEGIRRVTTSCSIKLLEKKRSEYVWELLKATIDAIHKRFEKSASDIVRDSEGALDEFVVRE